MEDSDGNLMTSPVITREAVLSRPPKVEYNPRDRAFGYVLPESINDDGSIDTGRLVNGSLLSNGYGYHSYPTIEFESDGGSGASARAVFEESQVKGVDILDGGSGYTKFKKLTGTVKLGRANDVLEGIGTLFMSELSVNQPLLIGYADSSEPLFTDSDKIFYLDSYQSINEIIIDRNIDDLGLDFSEREYSLFTFGTKILVKGGMDTAAEPLHFVEGAELSIGLFAEDPEGYTMLGDNFTVFVNGVEDELFEVQGNGPFYRVVRAGEPLPQGEYKVRIQVTDPDGVSGSSQPLDIRIAAGFDPVIHMVSPINEKVNYLSQRLEKLDTFAYPSTVHFTFEARDFDGVIQRVEFYANSKSIGYWPPEVQGDNEDSNDTAGETGTWREGDTNRFTIAYSPDFPGTFNISASAMDDKGQTNFSQIQPVNFVAPYRQGSLPPKVFLRYPDAGPRPDTDPLVMETESYTDTSIIPLTSRAYDLDGSLESLNYYVDGKLIPVRTGYIQVIDAPLDGEYFEISDGFTVPIAFEFDDTNDLTNPGRLAIPISHNFYYLDVIADCQEITANGGSLSYTTDQAAEEYLFDNLGITTVEEAYDYLRIYDVDFVDCVQVLLDGEIPVKPNKLEAIESEDDVFTYLEEEYNLDKSDQPRPDLLEQIALEFLRKLGIDRIEIPAPSLLEEILIGLKVATIDQQRTTILEKIVDALPDNFEASAELIGMNGIYFRHKDPGDSSANDAYISSNTEGSIQHKTFSSGMVRFPSRDSENYHFTQLWTPPNPGVFTIGSSAEDGSGSVVFSTPETITVDFGSTPPEVFLTSPMSGTQRSVSQFGKHAVGTAWQEVLWSWTRGWYYSGRIISVNLMDRGAGYITAPDVEFYGSGYNAQAIATIEDDASHPRFGQIKEVEMVNRGEGYYGDTIVEFRGGLGQEAIFLNATAKDADGEIKSVEFLSNGESLTNDLTAPYSMQQAFSVGYYEFIAIAKDDAGNLAASPPARLNISTTQGSAPSGMIINPLPPMGQELSELGQGYFWEFVRA